MGENLGRATGGIDFQSALRDEGILKGLSTQGFVRGGELHPGLLPVAPPGLDFSRVCPLRLANLLWMTAVDGGSWSPALAPETKRKDGARNCVVGLDR